MRIVVPWVSPPNDPNPPASKRCSKSGPQAFSRGQRTEYDPPKVEKYGYMGILL